MNDAPRANPRSASQSPDHLPRDAREMLARGREFLERRSVEEWRLDAELLVAETLGLDRLHLFLELDRPVSADEVQRARALLVRRGKGEPTAYLIGRREFYGRDFSVGPGVLVPRPETELLVDVTRAALAQAKTPRIAEFGTGSGCIAITLALELEGAEISAVDVSSDALAFAEENAKTLGVAIRFVEGDGLGALQLEERSVAWIVANPPYIDPAVADSLAREVSEHEPVEALFAPSGDPDFWIKELLRQGEPLLTPSGGWTIELGYDQGQRAVEHVRSAGYSGRVHKDLEGVSRVLEVRRGELGIAES